jgi:hypothetical protein
MAEPMPPAPTFNAMLICDHAIREERTGKISLIGIFAHIWTMTFPALHGGLAVYANLGDAQGRYRFGLELVDDLKPIGRGEIEMEVADRMKPAELVFELPNLIFEHAGRYDFILYANGLMVGRKSFDVIKLDRPPGGAS